MGFTTEKFRLLISVFVIATSSLICSGLKERASVPNGVKCRSLPAPLHGSITYMPVSFSGRHAVHSKAYFACDDWHTAIGRMNATCMYDGTWSTVPPYCLDTRCKRIRSKVEKGRTCRKPCSRDKDCNRKKGRKCLCDDWCGKSCYNPQDKCPLPAQPQNGRIVKFDTLAYGHKIAYECLDGFSLSGPKIRRCRSDEKWTGEDSRCLRTLSVGRSTGVEKSPATGCGRTGDTTPVDFGRIIGGQNARPGAWPWQAIVFRRDHNKSAPADVKEKLLGGGSILSDTWILTAAHSFDFVKPYIRIEDEFLVAVGLTTLPPDTETWPPDIHLYQPGQLVTHPKYREGLFDYDYALIKIGQRLKPNGKRLSPHRGANSNKITFTRRIGPVCLPCTEFISGGTFDQRACNNWEKSIQQSKKDSDRDVVATGFGYIEYNQKDPAASEVHEHLQQGELRLENRLRCAEGIDEIKAIEGDPLGNITLTDRMICADARDKFFGADSCKGDSGGPLARKIDGSGDARYAVVGIVSFGYGCSLGYPGYYSSVSSVMTWIINIIGKSALGQATPDGISSGTASFVWDAWSKYGVCTVTCGGGIKKRSRSCKKGKCIGRNTETTACNTADCPTYVFGSWLSWEACSVTCGTGRLVRKRKCFEKSPRKSVKVELCSSLGSHLKTRTCNRAPCDIDECSTGMHSCDRHATCKDRAKGYECTCNEGYYGNGSTCTSYASCGESGTGPSFGRVFDGEDAEEGEWPWHVLLYYNKGRHSSKIDRKWQFGGGSVINAKWILTAAHNFNRLLWTFHKKNFKAGFLMAFGVTQYPSTDHWPEYMRVHEPDNVIRHTEYDYRNPLNYTYDIALIRVGNRLKRDGKKLVRDNNYPSGLISFSKYIRPICLPCIGDISTPYVGNELDESDFKEARCSSWANANVKVNSSASAGRSLASDENKIVVTGFGLTSAPTNMSAWPDILQKGRVSILSSKRCQRAATSFDEGGLSAVYTPDLMLCAGTWNPALHTDACKGDSGGALVKEFGKQRSAGSAYYIQVGIVSWGDVCAPNGPGFYTSVTPLMSWILTKQEDSENP